MHDGGGRTGPTVRIGESPGGRTCCSTALPTAPLVSGAAILVAVGAVGPPLPGVGRRTCVAGEVPNTPRFMVRWIENPQAIEPGTAMPNLGVSDAQARDIAAYLYTLR